MAKRAQKTEIKKFKQTLIQGEIETPKVPYSINRENWNAARELFNEFFGECHDSGVYPRVRDEIKEQ